MKNLKKGIVTFLIIFTSIFSQNIIASSYPSSGLGVDNSSSGSTGSTSGYVSPSSSISPTILGGGGTSYSDPYIITDSNGGLGSDVSSDSPTNTDPSYYILASGAGFKIGDYVSMSGVIYKLVASSYSNYLEAVPVDSNGNVIAGGEVAGGTEPDYFLLPLGNGNLVLIGLMASYCFYIFYRNYRKKKKGLA